MFLFLLASFIEDDADMETFLNIYKNYRLKMFYIARDIVKDFQLAEDILQESFLCVAKNIKKFNGLTDKETVNLLYTVTKNKAIDFYRKRNKNEVLTDKEVIHYKADHNTGMIYDSLNDIIDAILSLDGKNREILELYLFYEFSRKEIAAILNLKYDTVRKRINKAMEVLTIELNKRGIYE